MRDQSVMSEADAALSGVSQRGDRPLKDMPGDVSVASDRACSVTGSYTFQMSFSPMQAF